MKSLVHVSWFVLLSVVFVPVKAAQIRNIEADDQAGVSKVSLLLDGKVKYKVFMLDTPPRLVLDLIDTKNVAGRLKIDSERIKAVRHAPREDGDYRIVLDLVQSFPYRHRFESDSRTGKSHIILEIGLLKTAVPPPVQKQLRNIVVVIDPGHGGRDSGAIGKSGAYEKDLVLEISKKIYRSLQGQFGIDVYLTRNTNQYIALRDRIKFAQNKRTDVFLSIHADALKEDYVSGASVYILSKRGASSEAARLLAKRESKDFFAGDVEVKDEEAASMLVELLQTATLQYSKSMADVMIDTLDDKGFRVRKKIESAGFAVLKSVEIPSLLIEVGYLSNAAEEKKLKQPSYQQRLAATIVVGVKRYLYQHASPGSWLAQYTFNEYTVLQGDSLWLLARRNKVNINVIKQVAGLQSNRLSVGQKIILPLKK